ncbi:hypothetical protein OIU77_018775 [Salix suchowensis]|uniref:Histone deacetylase domain-containing protein n=1 Tax=Salix suchowensis TaxID=1278906 RepID=A0ABQ9CFS7_9ROSI|nr:hypothetical protein OIU77_018775 [Salix suchowensis]
MELQTFRLPYFAGCRYFQRRSILRRQFCTKLSGFSISCSYSLDKDPNLLIEKLTGARVIYSVAPAMGHNQEAHPESHLRVPAIVSALEKAELTSKFRGSEIIELQNFKPASVDDIANVHAKAYVAGLEKAMDQASEQGIIYIDGSGPTYATATTFQESLVAAGAGITLVNSVVMSQPGMLQHLRAPRIHLLDLL